MQIRRSSVSSTHSMVAVPKTRLSSSKELSTVGWRWGVAFPVRDTPDVRRTSRHTWTAHARADISATWPWRHWRKWSNRVARTTRHISRSHIRAKKVSRSRNLLHEVCDSNAAVVRSSQLSREIIANKINLDNNWWIRVIISHTIFTFCQVCDAVFMEEVIASGAIYALSKYGSQLKEVKLIFSERRPIGAQ